MKKALTIILMATMFQIGCTEEELCLTGSGQTGQYVIELGSFDQISLSGPVNLNLSQGTEQSVVVVAEPEMYAALEYNVYNGMLDIGYENVSCFNTIHGVDINITIPTVEDINFEGSGTIKSIGDLLLTSLDIRTSGVAKTILSGQIANLSIFSDGSLEVNNFELQTESTDLKIEGSANAEVNCSNTLNIDVDGYASVTYKGQPQISQKVKGNLDLVNGN